jgi:hypothetical protein
MVVYTISLGSEKQILSGNTWEHEGQDVRGIAPLHSAIIHPRLRNYFLFCFFVAIGAREVL